MTVKEKLLEEFGAAIVAIYGDQADAEHNDDMVAESDIDAIAEKVKFYIFG